MSECSDQSHEYEYLEGDQTCALPPETGEDSTDNRALCQVSALACIGRVPSKNLLRCFNCFSQHGALSGLVLLAGTHYSLSTVFEEDPQDVTGQELPGWHSHTTLDSAHSHTTLDSCMQFWHAFRYALSQKSISQVQNRWVAFLHQKIHQTRVRRLGHSALRTRTRQG